MGEEGATAWRSFESGISATIATVAAWRKSAVSKPVKVAPTIVPFVLSTTIREVPPVSLPWKLAPGVPSVGTSTAPASMPASLACASVLPAAATWGSVKVTRGDPIPSATASVPRPRMFSVATQAWYLPMWVKSALPLTSPIA